MYLNSSIKPAKQVLYNTMSLRPLQVAENTLLLLHCTVGVAVVYSQQTLTAIPTCISHGGKALHETYIVGKRNWNRFSRSAYMPYCLQNEIHYLTYRSRKASFEFLD